MLAMSFHYELVSFSIVLCWLKTIGGNPEKNRDVCLTGNGTK